MNYVSHELLGAGYSAHRGEIRGGFGVAEVYGVDSREIEPAAAVGAAVRHVGRNHSGRLEW